MCVIAVKPAGVKWPAIRYLKNCYRNNPDGAGLAWVDEAGLHVVKGYFNWKGLYRDLRALESYTVVLHCRVATHGSVSKKNCHPFLLDNGIAMAHNGIIGIEPAEKDMTDSETFGKRYLEKLSVEQLEQPHMIELLERAIGSSKIVLLRESGMFTILNKHLGETFKGVWFSNDSFDDYDVMLDDFKKYGFKAKEPVGTYKRVPLLVYNEEYDEYAEYEEYTKNAARCCEADDLNDPFYVDDDFRGFGTHGSRLT